MAERTFTKLVCDQCLPREQNAVEHLSIQLMTGRRTVTLDLCAAHKKEFLKNSAPVKEQRPKSTMPCPLCDHSFKGKIGLGIHTVKTHGKSLQELGIVKKSRGGRKSQKPKRSPIVKEIIQEVSEGRPYSFPTSDLGPLTQG